MTLSRRRFLAISAAFAAGPAAAAPTRWHGRALGADVAIDLSGPPETCAASLKAALAAIRRVEGLFSLHDPASALSRLNRDGVLHHPPEDFLALCRHADTAHRLTGGRFDPTVQPLWRALAAGQPTDAPRAAIGWTRVTRSAAAIRLAPGQALTFNGIAQGFATDIVARILRQRGHQDILVDIGEQVARGAPRRLGLEDPQTGLLGWLTLTDGAVATSSPSALRLGAETHILSPTRDPVRWSTVSVVADSAALADGLSTGLCFATEGEIAALATSAGVRRIYAVTHRGDLRRFG